MAGWVDRGATNNDVPHDQFFARAAKAAEKALVSDELIIHHLQWLLYLRVHGPAKSEERAKAQIRLLAKEKGTGKSTERVIAFIDSLPRACAPAAIDQILATTFPAPSATSTSQKQPET